MKRFLTTLVVAATLVGCSSDDDKKTTNAQVTVKTTSGIAVSGITVYAYGEDTWSVSGDDTFFADGQSVTSSTGVAKFDNIEYPFTYVGNNQETFRFSAHYSKNGVNYTKVVGQTITKGESAVVTITVN